MPIHPERLHHDLGAVLALARLLERFDPGGAWSVRRSTAQVVLDAGQRCSTRPARPGALKCAADAHPAAAELYENLHYAQARLCRRTLGACSAARSPRST